MQMKHLFGSTTKDDYDDTVESVDSAGAGAASPRNLSTEPQPQPADADADEEKTKERGGLFGASGDAGGSFFGGVFGGGAPKPGAAIVATQNPLMGARRDDLRKLDADFAEPFETRIEDTTPPPNFLKIGLHSARNLAAVDSEVFSKKRWSDPRVKFVVKKGPTRKEVSVRSKVKEKDLNPVWKQVFVLGIDPDPAEDSWSLDVEVIVEDYDLTSGADRMGSFTMALQPHETAGGAWKALEDADGRVVKETKKEVQ